jgi:gamma-glutamylputrescine oxidase
VGRHRDAGPGCSPLGADVDADVCVIGGGYTGLACALALAENGTDVAVLETQHIGHGAPDATGARSYPA